MAHTRSPQYLRLLTKVSRLYFENDFSEIEIARRLRLSRSKISRMLKEARQIGIVRINVVSPSAIYADLELRLETQYQLDEALVVDVTNPNSKEEVSRALGIAAAMQLQDTLQDEDVIGITWGSTLREMVNAIQPQRSQQNHVVQIIGGLGKPNSEMHATDLCRRMANALQANLILLPAPGIMESVQAKDAILSDHYIQQAIQHFQKINLAYVGIGTPTPDSIVMRDGSIMSEKELDELLRKGAVGDIALRYFDKDGQPVDSDLDRRVIGMTFDQLKKVQRVVGIAGGLEKVAAIRGALAGRYIHVLVTDQAVAELLVS